MIAASSLYHNDAVKTISFSLVLSRYRYWQSWGKNFDAYSAEQWELVSWPLMITLEHIGSQKKTCDSIHKTTNDHLTIIVLYRVPYPKSDHGIYPVGYLSTLLYK